MMTNAAKTLRDAVADKVAAVVEDANLRGELAARRLLWIIADMHGGTVIISKASLDRFEPAGTLIVGRTEQGGAKLEARRDHSHNAGLPPVKYEWDK